MALKLKRVNGDELVEGRVYQNNPTSNPWRCSNLTILRPIQRVKYDSVYENGKMYAQNYTTLRNFYEVLEEGEAQMTTKELYQIKGTDTYGTILATNSQGLKVFEVRGTGEVKTVKKEDLEEVIPYTVSGEYFSGSTSYSFFAESGEYEVGDIIFNTEYSTPFVITSVDTKSKKATKWLVGSVVRPTKVVKAPE